jgi:glutaredoxin-related protein
MSAAAAAFAVNYHADVVDRVRKAVAANDVVVVGMAWNASVKKVRAALDEAGIKHEYLELGNYAGMWRERLGVKLWTGWPTFPQVFVKGTFIGGFELTRDALADGSLRKLLAA